jgi:FtsP/CotA-like multicopper oxidase with cupredoxin domain
MLKLTTTAPHTASPAVMPNPGGMPDYFNVANWAYTPNIRKFVDTLPGLGYANRNNLGQYIPVAVADINTYVGSDYYVIGLQDYNEQMHSDLPATRLRGYRQLNTTDPNIGASQYLGPLIIAQRDRPVRVKFTNQLGAGTAGNLFLPVDTTVMGAGMGPDNDTNGNPIDYQQNRATLHLHGGATPWISDGTPHQWTVPAGDVNAHYQKGVSTQNVPDMPAPGQGSMTFYYTNQQSARLMFYHDHSYGTTRLNVYAGEAAGYLLTDPNEEALINSGKLPNLGGVYRYGIPLIIQDKTFVDANTLPATDPTWNWGTTPGMANTGNLWFPHVYMPNQNPADPNGANAFGRWDYGCWFWPPILPSQLAHPPITLLNGTVIPGTPNPSMVMEAFMDTPLVNGTPYPVLPVQRTAYRFRILNACNDRMLNLQLYYVDPNDPNSTEVNMVPAVQGIPGTAGYSKDITDGRDGGVPNATLAGPNMIQIGTEGGFLPLPAVIPSTPIGYNYNRRDIVVLNVSTHGLLLGPAERADVIVDFSGVPDGSKLILYNDAPAPVPGFDPRLDYYTGDPCLTDTGGAPSTRPGFGPNIRTIMQFRVAVGGPVAAAFDVNALSTALPAAFAASQPAIIVPETTYPTPYTAANSTYSKIQDTNLTFTPAGSATPITIEMKPKAIQELFELDYGRMNSTLGVELPFTNFNTQTTIPYGYIDPPTEIIQNGGIQIWKITHNGVDTHAIHFHLFNVQLINRVGWDGAIRPPERNELGWKETVRMNPLEDAIVALKPVAPTIPFLVPDSIRLLDPTMPEGSTMGFSGIDPNTGNAVVGGISNVMTNFGWEYVWHCHLLGHEEMDMMRPIVFQAGQTVPSAPMSVIAAADNARATVSFSAPFSNGGSPILGYTVTSLPPGGVDANAGTTLTTHTITGLHNGTAYTFTVTATNAIGTGPASLPSNIVTPLGLPGAPTIGLAAVASITSATVSFTAPASNGGSTITLYTATSNPGGKTATGTSSPITVTGLATGVTYRFSVKATNAAGTGPASGQSNSVLIATVPGTPTIGLAAVAGPTSATVNFAAAAANGSPVTGYTVTSIPAGGVDAGAGTTTTTHTITGLTTGGTYAFTVRATNAIGTGPASAQSNSISLVAPAAPTKLVAIASVLSANPPTVSLTWVDNSNNETGFTIQRATNTGFTAGLTVFAVGANVTTYTDTTVVINTKYYYRVLAYNPIGNSAWSNTANATTPRQLPAAPSNLAVGTITRTTVALTWTDNATNETGFVIQRARNAAFTTGATSTTVNTPNLAARTMTGLTRNTTYYYRVAAHNAAGNSAWSNVVTFKTLP